MIYHGASMDRALRLRQFWSWLPSFRAVAETEHLPTAAQQVGLTASALSRSIKDLEAVLGVQLFDRKGRRLALNARGQALLGSLRDAMRRLDDGVDAVLDEVMAGPLRLTAPGPFVSAYVVPVVRRLREAYPRVRPSLASLSASDANARLLDGSLDLALLDDPIAHPRLVVERLAALAYGVYAGPGHPLLERPRLTPADLEAHPFVGPPDGGDHWPVDWRREVAVECHQLQVGMELCASSRLLALLPDPVAQGYRGPGGLHRLPLAIPSDVALFTVRREPLGPAPLLDWVAAALREELTRERAPG